MKKFYLILSVLILSGLIFYSCKDNKLFDPTLSNLKAPPQKLDAPVLTCTGNATGASIEIQVCAGNSGAPAGFTVQWETKADFDANGWSSENSSYCAASFSGVPGCSQYNLGSNACITVNIGELSGECGVSGGCGDLLCGTEYVFRAFAHNVPGGSNKSDFSITLYSCPTLECGGGGCTYTQGYWASHGPEGCSAGNNENVWPQSVMDNGLSLGQVNYAAEELCSILNTPVNNNGLISLAHQLIAVKINIANGSDPAEIEEAMDNAEALIGNLIVPPVGVDYLSPSAINSIVSALTDYNEGATGPGHCSE